MGRGFLRRKHEQRAARAAAVPALAVVTGIEMLKRGAVPVAGTPLAMGLRAEPEGPLGMTLRAKPEGPSGPDRIGLATVALPPDVQAEIEALAFARNVEPTEIVRLAALLGIERLSELAKE